MIYLTTSLRESQPTGPSVLYQFVWAPPATPGVVILTSYPVKPNRNTAKLYSRETARAIYNRFLARGASISAKVEVHNSTGSRLDNDMSIALMLISNDADTQHIS